MWELLLRMVELLKRIVGIVGENCVEIVENNCVGIVERDCENCF